jgi:hypothetical protein
VELPAGKPPGVAAAHEMRTSNAFPKGELAPVKQRRPLFAISLVGCPGCGTHGAWADKHGSPGTDGGAVAGGVVVAGKVESVVVVCVVVVVVVRGEHGSGAWLQSRHCDEASATPVKTVKQKEKQKKHKALTSRYLG